jgi:hypothetical protein
MISVLARQLPPPHTISSVAPLPHTTPQRGAGPGRPPCDREPRRLRFRSGHADSSCAVWRRGAAQGIIAPSGSGWRYGAEEGGVVSPRGDSVAPLLCGAECGVAPLVGGGVAHIK